MPFLEGIVGQINDSILNKIANSSAILSIRGISKQVVRDQDAIPSYIDNSGNGVFNAFDDNYSICVYHKCDNMIYASKIEGTFGDGQELQQETAMMSLFCWADRARLKTTQEAIASAIASAIPYTVDTTFKTDRNLTGVSIEIVQIDNNPLTVWGREFQGIEYQLPPESIYFQIIYKIETVYDKGCLEICEEC